MVFLSADLHSLIEAYFTLNYGMQTEIELMIFFFLFISIRIQHNFAHAIKAVMSCYMNIR